MDEENIKKILDELESGYDRIADKFSASRSVFWPKMSFISDFINDGDNVFDYGCGNGRLLEIIKNKKINYTGADVSQKLINIAKSRYPEHNFVKISSQDILPFPGEFYNKAISIAVFHHFPPEHAQKIARELFRTLQPGGIIIISLWNLWQKRFWKYFFENLLCGKSWRDISIPFNDESKNITFDRYHHAYTKLEIKKIFCQAGFQCEKIGTIDGKNIIFVGKKE